jgi:phosphoribosylformimino-5-aminoimidazole carboxamide ribotide isomerase
VEIIPVLDLMHGQVVHARRGERAHYRPIVSSLCTSAEPVAVLEALLQLHPFRSVYLADLDAILGRSERDFPAETLARRFPHIRFWVDQGLRTSPRPLGAALSNRLEVVGSESLHDGWREKLAARPAPFILSLDFGAAGFLGPRELLESPALWPELVILMALARVGSQAGPDIALLEHYLRTCPANRFIAAGGVRNAEDLWRLEKAGASGVLLASALHDGSIGCADLSEFG